MIKHSTKFYLLSQPNVNGLFSVRMRVSWAGNRFECVLPIAVDPKHWDEAHCKVKKSFRPDGDASACQQMNELITEARHHVDRFFLTCEVNQGEAAVYELKKWMDDSVAIRPSSPKMRLLSDAIGEYLASAPEEGNWSPRTTKTVRKGLRIVLKYRPTAKMGEVDADFVKGYVEYLFDNGNCNATTHKEYQRLRTFLNWCRRHDIPFDPSALKYNQRFKGTSTSANEVNYLTWEELMMIKLLPLSDHPMLDRARDVFVFSCFCGLRYADMVLLKKSQISDGKIRVVTSKTIVAINIELNQTTKSILDKYKDYYPDDRALPLIGLSKYNERLKEVARMAGIDAPARKVYFVKAERVEEIYPKCEIISSHWARHTFIVNALRLGIPGEVIMSWTGHLNYDTMKPYLKIMNTYRAELMQRFDNACQPVPLPMPTGFVGEVRPIGDTRRIDGSWRKRITEDANINMTTKMELLSIMREVSKGGVVYLGDLAKSLKLHVNTIRRRMEFLVENGYLTCTGYGRSIRWHVVE